MAILSWLYIGRLKIYSNASSYSLKKYHSQSVQVYDKNPKWSFKNPIVKTYKCTINIQYNGLKLIENFGWLVF